jgi:hypothetical protein
MFQMRKREELRSPPHVLIHFFSVVKAGVPTLNKEVGHLLYFFRVSFPVN